MSKQFNNKILLYLLAGLSVILLLTFVIKIPKEKATLKSRLFELDTLKVSTIALFPKAENGKEIEFSRKSGKWIVKMGNITSAVQEGAVQNMILEAVNIKPQSLAETDRSKWEEYELTDSLGTRVKFLNDRGKVLADLMIGKFTYKQVADPYGGYGGNNIVGTSFVRLYNEKDVYATEGFISFSFNRRFDDWRDKTFIQANKDDITSVKFIYPADSSFILSKSSSGWDIAGMVTDSLNAANYVNSLSLMDGQDFKNNYQPVAPPFYQLTVEGNNLLNFTVKCYQGDGIDEYILNSSLNPEIYFTSASNGLFDRLFKPKDYFLTGK